MPYGEFSGKKNKISALVKNPFNLRKLIFIWKVNEKTSSLSPITNHAKTLCKECKTKSLTIQALGQLWITQFVMFPGNVYSPNVVAKYYVMFLWAQELKERGFKFFKLLGFFLALSVTISKPPRMMFRGWCHHQPITGHFSALFVISPLRRVLLS